MSDNILARENFTNEEKFCVVEAVYSLDDINLGNVVTSKNFHPIQLTQKNTFSIGRML